MVKSESTSNGDASDSEEDPTDEIMFARHARCNHELRQEFLRYDHQKKNRKRREKEAYGRDRVTRSAAHQAQLQAALVASDPNYVAIWEAEHSAAVQAHINDDSKDPPFIPQEFVMPSMTSDVTTPLHYNYEQTSSDHLNYEALNGLAYIRPNAKGAYIRCISDQELSDTWGEVEEPAENAKGEPVKIKSGRRKRTSRGHKTEDSGTNGDDNNDEEEHEADEHDEQTHSRKKSRAQPRTPRTPSASSVAFATAASAAAAVDDHRRRTADRHQLEASLEVATTDGKRKRKLTIKGAGLATLSMDEAAQEAQEDAEAEADAAVRLKNGGRLLPVNGINHNKMAKLDATVSSGVAAVVAAAAALNPYARPIPASPATSHQSSLSSLAMSPTSDGSRPRRSGAGRKGKLLAMGLTVDPLRSPSAAAAAVANGAMNKRTVQKLLASGLVPASLGTVDNGDDDDDDFQPETYRKRAPSTPYGRKKGSSVVIISDDDTTSHDDSSSSITEEDRYIPLCDIYPRRPIALQEQHHEILRLQKHLELIRLQRNHAKSEPRKAGSTTTRRKPRSSRTSRKRKAAAAAATAAAKANAAAQQQAITAATNAAVASAAASAIAAAAAHVATVASSVSASSTSFTPPPLQPLALPRESSSTTPVPSLTPNSNGTSSPPKLIVMASPRTGSRIIFRASSTTSSILPTLSATTGNANNNETNNQTSPTDNHTSTSNSVSLRSLTPTPTVATTTTHVTENVSDNNTNDNQNQYASLVSTSSSSSFVPQFDDGPQVLMSVNSSPPSTSVVSPSSLSTTSSVVSLSSTTTTTMNTSTNGTTLFSPYATPTTSTSSTRVTTPVMTAIPSPSLPPPIPLPSVL
jgi:hypothetical protein